MKKQIVESYHLCDFTELYDNNKIDDCEQLLGLPFKEEPNYILKFINIDGTQKK